MLYYVRHYLTVPPFKIERLVRVQYNTRTVQMSVCYIVHRTEKDFYNSSCSVKASSLGVCWNGPFAMVRRTIPSTYELGFRKEGTSPLSQKRRERGERMCTLD